MKITKKLVEDKRGVFGLTSVQQFFAIVLGLALLAYVIVVIMGTLSESTILPSSSETISVLNESAWLNNSGYTLSTVNIPGFSSATIVQIVNTTSGAVIRSGNYSLTAPGLIKNASAVVWSSVKITYTYKANSITKNNANAILGNVSGGVSGFFGNVSPVYAILAILVIILVLVVLVRVVNGSNSGASSAPQL